jgi:hypothetical protein
MKPLNLSDGNQSGNLKRNSALSSRIPIWHRRVHPKCRIMLQRLTRHGRPRVVLHNHWRGRRSANPWRLNARVLEIQRREGRELRRRRGNGYRWRRRPERRCGRWDGGDLRRRRVELDRRRRWEIGQWWWRYRIRVRVWV